MSSTRFVISDHHLRHPAIYRFTAADGARIRPWAETMEAGDERMIEAWNAVVRPSDTVLHLGDIAIRRAGLALLTRMNGRKILVRGNHDIFKIKDYAPHFADIRGTHKDGPLLLSHYPVHPDSIPRWASGCVHGHTHDSTVMWTNAAGETVPDPRYLNVCVEATGLAPIPIEEAEARLRAQQDIAPPAGQSAAPTLADANANLFRRYAAIVATAREAGPADPFAGDPRRSLANLAWICAEGAARAHAFDCGKTSRWLGFVQGCLASRDLIDVDTERDHTRPIFHAVARAEGRDPGASAQRPTPPPE